jgi:hypothetical protein
MVVEREDDMEVLYVNGYYVPTSQIVKIWPEGNVVKIELSNNQILESNRELLEYLNIVNQRRVVPRRGDY